MTLPHKRANLSQYEYMMSRQVHKHYEQIVFCKNTEKADKKICLNICTSESNYT